MNSITLNINEETIKKMQSFYKDYMIENNNIHALFIAKTNNCTITVYKTKKALFQGKNAKTEAVIWQNITNNNFYLESIGSDEVGTGDYFGPVIVCSVCLERNHLDLIKKYNIDDSKKLTDNYIMKIAPLFYKIIPYSLLVVSNEKYNKLIEQKKLNLNQIKALLHKQAIENLIKKCAKDYPIILDQFCSKENFNKYINDDNFSKKIIFETKAETKYASVALASIMARYKFLIEFDKLSANLNTKLIKGASTKVDEQGISLVNKFGKDILSRIAKLHFKNTERILQNKKG